MSHLGDAFATSSPADTVADDATWDFWPNAPPGDFAHLIPASPESRQSFQAVVRCMLEHPDKKPWSYSARYMHWECSAPDDSETQALLESTPETGLSSDADHRGQPQRPPSLLQAYTGYYRLNMLHKNHVWVIGAGRKDRDVEFVATTPERKATDGIFGRHAKIRRDLNHGSVIVTTDSHPVIIDGHRLSRQRDKIEEPRKYQLVAGSRSIVTIGRLTYALEMQNLLPEVDKAQIEEARKSAGYSGVGADFYLTPTPNMSAMLIGNYHVFEPFAFGSVGTVQYVTHAVTGRPFALKKMRRRNDHDRRAIENEIDILQKISHPHVCRVVEVLTTRFDRPDIRQPDVFAEISVVLDPPARRTLEAFVNTSYSDEGEPCLEPGYPLEDFHHKVALQLASVGAYLHKQGIMHRDYKLENVAVVRTSPDVNVVLIDFGHAVEAIESRDHMKGTVRYLAPEVLALKEGRSSRSYNCLVDVWALGIIMLELGMQRRVQTENMAQQWAEELEQRAREPEATPLAAILSRLLCVEAGKRITMQQIVETLDRQVSSAGKRKTEGGGEPACTRKPFSRRIVLEMPPDHGA